MIWHKSWWGCRVRAGLAALVELSLIYCGLFPLPDGMRVKGPVAL